jgi:hypothetical protein
MGIQYNKQVQEVHVFNWVNSMTYFMCADLEISDLVSESEAGLSFSRTPGQLLSLTSHLSFVSMQFSGGVDFWIQVFLVPCNGNSGWIVLL